MALTLAAVLVGVCALACIVMMGPVFPLLDCAAEHLARRHRRHRRPPP
jgi:hypothetical protein